MRVQGLNKSGCGMTNWTCVFDDKRYCVTEREEEKEEERGDEKVEVDKDDVDNKLAAKSDIVSITQKEAPRRRVGLLLLLAFTFWLLSLIYLSSNSVCIVSL